MSISQQLREWRHNPCLMRPISAILLLVMGIFWFVVLVWKLPSAILTYIVITPLIQRFSWIIEFWYPTSIGKWLHLGVVKLSSNNKKKGKDNNTYHSRFLETRLTIIPNRIYVHPIPQLLDNLGYLVVCLPPPPTTPSTGNTDTSSTTDRKNGSSNSTSTTHRQTSSGTTATATTTSSSTEVVVVADETTPLDSNSNKNRNRGSRDDPPGVKIHIDPNANQQEEQSASNTSNTIVAFVVDCGDAETVLDITDQITKNFYSGQNIHIQSILSTHKHHDHTAGNLDMLNHHNTGDGRLPLKWIFGGAVENVPGCNYPLQNGDLLPLPKCDAGTNDMNVLVEVEAIATPAHTRGSITYILRALLDDNNNDNNSACCCCLFTGDTVFSAGGGVPFEADLDNNQEHHGHGTSSSKRRMNANSYIHASASMNAIERCFAEVIYRSVPLPPLPQPSPTTTTSTTVAMVTSNEQILVFPGHEYTHELLSRQFGASTQQQESCKWKYFTPQAFFETVSHMYVTLHKRNLPSNTGKLLTVPSSLKLEMHINPHFRTMKQRGVIIINALKLWNRHFAHDRVSESSMYHQGPAFDVDRQSSSSSSAVTAASKKKKKKSLRSKEDQWNLDVSDINRNVFTTMYTTDLNKIIDDLASGKIDSQLAASRLRNLKSALDEPVLGRRPIPGTLPSSRNVYRGLLGLALLGSSPTAMTMSDARNMKLPEPIDSSSSYGIRVSKKRLTAVLYWLGLLNGEDGKLLVAIIQQLWKETHEYAMKKKKQIALDNKGDNKAQDDGEDLPESSRESTDLESMPETDDEVELGALKWVIYGIPEQPPRSWFGTYCTPCSRQTNDDSPSPDHPAGRSGMNRHNGELVRHDVFSCPMCRDSTGCPILSQQVEEVDNDAVGVGESQQQQVHTITSSTATIGDGVVDDEEDDAPDDERAAYVEVSPESLGSMLMKDI